MTCLHVHSCCRWLTYISYECEWQQLHNMFNKHKNDSDSCQCTELTVKLLTTS